MLTDHVPIWGSQTVNRFLKLNAIWELHIHRWPIFVRQLSAILRRQARMSPYTFTTQVPDSKVPGHVDDAALDLRV
jgi:hypothetical protein